jgi:hypothetical protein
VAELTGIQKLNPRYDKCVSSGGDYVRSSVRTYVFFVYNKFFLVTCFVNSLPEVIFPIALVNPRSSVKVN